MYIETFRYVQCFFLTFGLTDNETEIEVYVARLTTFNTVEFEFQSVFAGHETLIDNTLILQKNYSHKKMENKIILYL